MVEKKHLETVDQTTTLNLDLKTKIQQVDLKSDEKIDTISEDISTKLAENSILANNIRNKAKSELLDAKIDPKAEVKSEVINESTEVKIISDTGLKFDEKNGFLIDPNLRLKTKPIRRKETDLNNHPKKEELRAKVLDYIKQNPEDFDECDQDLLKTSDLWMNRFLNFRNQSFDSAYNQLIDTFKWRKEMEINTFDRTVTPIEAWMSGGVFVYLPDKNGNPVLYLRGSMHHKIEERFYKLFQKLLCLLIDNVDRLGNREFGWTTCLDLCGVGWSNVDVEMVHFLLNTSRMRYPNGCKWCIIHGLPWFLNFIARGILRAVPSDTAAKIKFVNGSTHRQLSVDEMISIFDGTDSNNNVTNSKSITSEQSEEDEKNRPKLEIEEYIDINNLPDFLGGKSRVNYRIAPRGSMTAMDIGFTRFNLTETKIKQLIKPFTRIVEQAHKTVEEFRTANFTFEFEYENLEQEFDKYQNLFT